MQKTTNEKIKKEVFVKKQDEKILVVDRKKLFPEGAFTGIKKIDFNQYQELIESNQQFLWRSKMETDPSFKQIIPYLVFNFQDKFFLMQRRSNASEVRLQNKYSLGIGGHIRQEDILNKNIVDWAQREFAEEVEYSGNLSFKAIGLLNDDSNEVGLVHTGFVFLLTGDSDKIKVRSELKEGNLLTLPECDKLYSKMESWSQIVFDFLRQN